MALPASVRNMPRSPITVDLIRPMIELARLLAKVDIEYEEGERKRAYPLIAPEELRSFEESMKDAEREVELINDRLDVLAQMLQGAEDTGGTVTLSDDTPAPVGDTASAGSGSQASRDDHVHRGVFSVRKDGPPAYGAIQLQGSGVSQSGRIFTFNGYGSLTGPLTPTGTPNGVLATFGLEAAPDLLLLFVNGQLRCDGEDFDLVGDEIDFTGYQIPKTGWKLRYYYATA